MVMMMIAINIYRFKYTAGHRHGTSVYTFVGRSTVEILTNAPISETFFCMADTATFELKIYGNKYICNQSVENAGVTFVLILQNATLRS